MSPSRPTAHRPPSLAGPVPALSAPAPAPAPVGGRGGRVVLAAVLLGLLVVVPVLATGRLLPGGGGGGGPSAPGAATVVRVVDGDTLVVDVGGADERVRLIGVDTPESVAPDRPVECWGHEASARLAELVPVATEVRLVRDVEPRDAYDRLLAYVYRSEDELFVNRALLDAGAAEVLPYPPNTTHRSEFAAAERAARTARAGLWGACGSADVPLAPGG